MNKTELLADLASREFIGFVGEPEPIKANGEPEIKPDGSKVYVVNAKEVVGKCAIYRNISFYVANEGEENEQAFYMQSEPKQTITE